VGIGRSVPFAGEFDDSPLSDAEARMIRATHLREDVVAAPAASTHLVRRSGRAVRMAVVTTSRDRPAPPDVGVDADAAHHAG
jgi:hypothetical protein